MNNRILLYIITGLIASIILPIVLQSGYIFAIDQALNTNGWIPRIGNHNYWVGWLSQLFVFFGIPIWLLEKILVVMTFSLPVVGMYLYFRSFVEMQSRGALFFALSFSIFNPMLYSRFLDGQVNIYLLYALFPLFLYFVKSFFTHKTLASAVIVGLWSVLLVCTSLHAVYFVLFVFLAYLAGHSTALAQKQNLVSLATGCIIIGALQLLWAIPLFTSPDEKVFSTVSQIERFDSSQQNAFAQIPSERNPYREILSMRGYWGDYENRFVESHDIFNDGSNIDWIYFIWFIILTGVVYAARVRARDSYVFLILGVLGIVLSLGVTNGTIFSPLNALLYDYLPYYAGFREPQKFVLFLIMSYIYFGYFGIIALGALLQKYQIQKTVAAITLSICILSPVLYNFNMLFGMRGQVSVQEYPQEWTQARDYLAQNSCDDCVYDTLVFPWHGYMSIGWTNKIVGSWITRYFGQHILYGDTIEIGSVYTSSTRSESRVVEKYIGPNGILRSDAGAESYNTFFQDMQDLSIRHILLLKESDFSGYQQILQDMREQDLLEIALENNMIQIYTIK